MVEAKGVNLFFPVQNARESKFQVLTDLNFTFNPGDRVGVLGANGAGKSTLLRLLAGVYTPTSGILKRQGDINTLLDVGAGMNSEANGIENIYIRGVMLGLSRKYIKTKIDEIVAESGLEDDINKPLRHYSSGMLIRLAFTVSLIKRADIFLMDEWLSVGDADFNSKASKRLKVYIENSSILVLASHSHQLLKETCNRFFRMHKGILIEVGEGDF